EVGARARECGVCGSGGRGSPGGRQRAGARCAEACQCCGPEELPPRESTAEACALCKASIGVHTSHSLVKGTIMSLMRIFVFKTECILFSYDGIDLRNEYLRTVLSARTSSKSGRATGVATDRVRQLARGRHGRELSGAATTPEAARQGSLCPGRRVKPPSGSGT